MRGSCHWASSTKGDPEEERTWQQIPEPEAPVEDQRGSPRWSEDGPWGESHKWVTPSKAMAGFWGATCQLESEPTPDAIWLILPLWVRSRNLGRAYEFVGVKSSQR